jgi:hypothetical protein
MDDEAPDKPGLTDLEKDRELLELGERRRAASDAFAWSVPALAVTAQAFLLNIALAADAAPLARLLAVVAGGFLLFGAYVFLCKQSYGFNLYDALIERQRKRLGLMSAHREVIEALDLPENSRERLNRAHTWLGYRARSVAVWKSVLLSLFLLNSLIGAYAVWALFDDRGWL